MNEGGGLDLGDASTNVGAHFFLFYLIKDS